MCHYLTLTRPDLHLSDSLAHAHALAHAHKAKALLPSRPRRRRGCAAFAPLYVTSLCHSSKQTTRLELNWSCCKSTASASEPRFLSSLFGRFPSESCGLQSSPAVSWLNHRSQWEILHSLCTLNSSSRISSTQVTTIAILIGIL